MSSGLCPYLFSKKAVPEGDSGDHKHSTRRPWSCSAVALTRASGDPLVRGHGFTPGVGMRRLAALCANTLPHHRCFAKGQMLLSLLTRWEAAMHLLCHKSKEDVFFSLGTSRANQIAYDDPPMYRCILCILCVMLCF